MKFLISVAIPEEPQTFVDYIDDDGLGNGPYRMQLTIWREGDHAFFDWSGTDPQALGPINFYLSEGMFKMFIGIYLIMVNDPRDPLQRRLLSPAPRRHAGGISAPAALPGRPRVPHARARTSVRRARRRAVQERAGAQHRCRLRHEPVHALFGLGGERGLLLLDGDPLRRDPGETDRGRDRRPLVVAAVREHSDRVPRGLLPAPDRRLHDGHRLRRPGPPPRRQRRREALRLPRAGRGLDPRRPVADPAVGRVRRAARSALGEAPQARRRDGAGPPVQVRQRRRGAGRHVRLPHGRGRRLERPGSTAPPTSSPATSRSGSSAASWRRRATASSSPTTARSTRGPRMRSGSANGRSAGTRPRSTSGRRSRRSSPAARRRRGSTRRRPRRRSGGHHSSPGTRRSRA